MGWDVGLRKRFKFASVALIIILFVAILAMGLWKNERIMELLWRAAFIVPMLKWLLDTIKKLNKDISRLQELDSDINNNETKTMEDLQDIQDVYKRQTPEFWKNLARENQLDFKTSGSAGKCIEGREFIIALPESFVQYWACLLYTSDFSHWRLQNGWDMKRLRLL